MCCGQPMSLCRETCFLTINTESYATGKKERTGNNSDGFNGKVRISRKRRNSRVVEARTSGSVHAEKWCPAHCGWWWTAALTTSC